MSVILGLDPGSLHTGYGLIEAADNKLSLITAGRISPLPAWNMPRRLSYIFKNLESLLDQFRPMAVAVEDVFTFKNPRSAIKLAQARGVAILAPALRDIPVFEYPPTLVKNTVSGRGQASKDQIAFMVGKILALSEVSREELAPDASDALAVAICHAGQNFKPQDTSSPAAVRRGKTSWRNLGAADLELLGYHLEKGPK